MGGVTLRARRGWMARHRPFVEVRLDDREAVVRASVDGRLAVSGRDVSTVSIRVLPLLGRSRGAPASLEVEELGLSGTELPRPHERLSRPCGEGPELTVDGISVPTRMDGPRSALWGEGDLTWQACAPVTLGAGPSHDIDVRGDPALRPTTVALLGPRALTAPAPTALHVTSRSPTHLTGTVGGGAQRLLALTMNHNDGWEASLEGQMLTPVVVDGFRQGFVVPEGASGAVEVRFAPDGPYRWALGVGLVLALLVPLTLLVPDRSRRPSTPSGDPRRRAAARRRHARRAGWGAPRRRSLGVARRGWGARPPPPARRATSPPRRGDGARRGGARDGIRGARGGHRAGTPDPPVGGGGRHARRHRGSGARRCGTRRAAHLMAGSSTATWLSHARARLTGRPIARSARIPPLKTWPPLTA